MAFRSPFGYGPGNYPMVPGQQQQQPRPGNAQYMQQGQPFPGMTPQTYPMMQQGNMHQAGAPGNMQAQMYPRQPVMMGPGMVYPGQQAVMMQQGFQGQPGNIQGAMMQQQQGQPPMQQRQLTKKEKQQEEKMRKERYFLEQKRKLQHFGTSGRSGLSLDMATSLVENLGGAGGGKAKRGQKQLAKHHSLSHDDFGDFHQGQIGGSQAQADSDDFGDFRTAAPQAQQPQISGDGDDFGDFLAAPSSGGSDTASIGPSEGSVTSEPPSLPEKMQEKKGPSPGVSLENMMMKSADLTAPAKSARLFHHKPSLNEAKAQPSQKIVVSKTFSGSKKSRQWMGSEEFSTMFVAAQSAALGATGQIGASEHSEGNAGIPDQPMSAHDDLIPQQGAVDPASKTQGRIPLPPWCQNEQSLPLVYHQVLEATFIGGSIQTDRLYPIFLLSGLEKTVLGQIWNLVNKTQPGQLVRQEMYLALALISLVQNDQAISLEHLYTLQEAPIPKFSPSGANMDQPPPPVAPSQPPPISSQDDDDFSDFHEAPSAAQVPDTAIISNSLQKDIDTHGGKFAREDRTPEDAIHISDFKTNQPELPPGDSLDEEFATFKSSRFQEPIPSIPPPGRLFPKGTQAQSFPLQNKPIKSATSPNLHALSAAGNASDDFGDFSSHTAVAADSNFGNFQGPKQPLGVKQEQDDWGGFADFKHSASVPDMQSMVDDKYDVFRELSSEGHVDVHVDGTSGAGEDNNEEEGTADIYSAFKKVNQAAPESKQGDFGDFEQGGLSSNSPSIAIKTSPSVSNADFAGFSPPSQGSNWAVQVGQSKSLSGAKSQPKEEDFENFFESRKGVSENKTVKEDRYSVFKMPQSQIGGKSLFESPSSTSSYTASTGGTPSASSKPSDDKYDIFRSMMQAEQLQTADDADEFGEFSSGSGASAGHKDNVSLSSDDKTSLNNYNSSLQLGRSDFLGIEFESAPPPISKNTSPALILDDLPTPDIAPSSILPFENESVTSSPSEFANKSGVLPKLGSIQDMDLKSLDLDLNLGSSSSVRETKSDSFGDFSSGQSSNANQFGNFSTTESFQPTAQETAAPTIHPGLSGPPLMPSGSLFVGDRYAEVAGDKLDEKRHAAQWERCLQSCYTAIQKANNIFNNISSSIVCKEVTTSSAGSQYLHAVIEVYRVACRVFTSIKAMGVETDTLDKLKKDIDLTWNNLSAFLVASPLHQPDDGSFVFKTAVLRPEPENLEKACGVCLLSVDARSKAFNRSEDFLKLSYGGRQYHATCANLWVNMVDSLLPALPLEALL